ncbi:hypothetical protein HDU98_006679, partial [Podochytrium sp. JEL0797]
MVHVKKCPKASTTNKPGLVSLSDHSGSDSDEDSYSEAYSDSESEKGTHINQHKLFAILRPYRVPPELVAM